MLVSGEIRLRLTDAKGRLALLVRGNELRRSGKRVLIPFGGGLHAEGNQGIDLRFSVASVQLEAVKRQFEEYSYNYILQEAVREFREEACDERSILTDAQVAACEYHYVRRLSFEGASVRHQTVGQPTYYLIGIVEVRPPGTVLDRLLEVSATPDSQLEFVPAELVATGGVTEKGSVLPALYSYLL